MTQEGFTDRISAYNDYASWLDLNSGYITPAAKTDLIQEINALSEDLNSIGLSLNADGRVYGTEKLGSALRNNMSSVRETLTGENGLFEKIGRRLTEILENGVTAYGIEQSGMSTYSKKGIFEGFKSRNEISMYA